MVAQKGGVQSSGVEVLGAEMESSMVTASDAGDQSHIHPSR